MMVSIADDFSSVKACHPEKERGGRVQTAAAA
jgi:hypothetical protein